VLAKSSQIVQAGGGWSLSAFGMVLLLMNNTLSISTNDCSG
jgi:hypothetical protein